MVSRRTNGIETTQLSQTELNGLAFLADSLISAPFDSSRLIDDFSKENSKLSTLARDILGVLNKSLGDVPTNVSEKQIRSIVSNLLGSSEPPTRIAGRFLAGAMELPTTHHAKVG